uniref:Uncharacterized protein n=1 Tax=Rhizophora mucronata TaxID=61149 RepID=A0A2P2JPJ2_RHIMU
MAANPNRGGTFYGGAAAYRSRYRFRCLIVALRVWDSFFLLVFVLKIVVVAFFFFFTQNILNILCILFY